MLALRLPQFRAVILWVVVSWVWSQWVDIEGECVRGLKTYMDNTSKMIIVPHHCLRPQRLGVRLVHVRRAIWPILRDRAPEVLAIVVESTVMVLNIASLAYRGIRDPSPIATEDNQMGEARTSRPVRAIDGRIVRDSGFRILIGTDDIAVSAESDDTLWLPSVAFVGDVGYRLPDCCAA